MDTLRIVFINRGKRGLGAIIAFFDILIWLFIVSSVLTDINSDPIKCLIYAVAYSLGNFIGITIEKKLAIGYCTLQVIVRDTEGYMLANLLRAHGFGVTTMEGDSLNYKRHILIIHLKRKRITEAAELIRDSTEDSVITVNDIKTVYGGFVKGK